MRDDDTVLGIEIDGDVRAYPWWIIDEYHVANDVVGGRPVIVSLCEACSSATAFHGLVAGRRLTFRFSHVFNGTPAMSDNETGSVWSTFLDRCVQGPLEGQTLQMLPLVQTEWGSWKELHPETLVLPGDIGSRTGHGSDHTIGSAEVPTFFGRTVDNWDDRIPHNTLVLGVLSGRARRVYPLEVLTQRGGVLNDELGGEPIVLLSDGRYAALAFKRSVDGRVLTFRADGGTALDHETGSRWGYDGKAVAGPLIGRSLSYVRCHVSEWYVWAAHFHDVDLFTGTMSLEARMDRSEGA
jgi:hypothetical protein